MRDTTEPYRLQLMMPQSAVVSLERLKKESDAASYSEVVRRSLQFYEKLINNKPDEIKLNEEKYGEINKIDGERSCRIQIILPKSSLERLQNLKKTKDSSLASVIRCALTEYWQYIDDPNIPRMTAFV